MQFLCTGPLQTKTHCNFQTNRIFFLFSPTTRYEYKDERQHAHEHSIQGDLKRFTLSGNQRCSLRSRSKALYTLIWCVRIIPFLSLWGAFLYWNSPCLLMSSSGVVRPLLLWTVSVHTCKTVPFAVGKWRSKLNEQIKLKSALLSYFPVRWRIMPTIW